MTISILIGVLQADPGVIREHDHIYKLYCHECQRVFHDRLIDKTDKKYFYGILAEMSMKHFSKVRNIFNSFNTLISLSITLQDISADHFEEHPVVFGDYIKIGASDADKLYEEINMKKVMNVLSEVHVMTCTNTCISYTYFVLSIMHHSIIALIFSVFQYLDDFNLNSSKEMKLVFFLDAIEHVSR